MKMLIEILLIIGLMLLLIGCSGDDDESVDKVPPTKPVLIPHLGDTGDGTITYNDETLILNDANNGIDAESVNNGIRLMWEPLIFDNDLERITIYRFMNSNTDDIVLVDYVTAEEVEYTDDTINNDLVFDNLFSYYIEVADQAGNSTFSDTVSYKLMYKPILNYPDNGTIVNDDLASEEGLKFLFYSTEQVDKFRVLLFNENSELIWIDNVNVDAEDLVSNYDGGSLSPGSYSWRVDAFRYDNELEFYYGSESYTSTIIVSD